MRFWITGLLLLFFSAACDKERLEIINFNTELSSRVVGENLKSAIIEFVPEEGYLIGGSDASGNALIIKTNFNGAIKSSTTPIGKGAIHKIWQDTLNGIARILVLSETENNSSLFTIDTLGKRLDILYDQFFSAFNQRIGNIEYVKAFDFVIDAQGNYMFIGALKQKAATESRLFSLYLDSNFSFIWPPRVYNNKSTGISLLIDKKGVPIISGYADQDKVAIYRLNPFNGRIDCNKTFFGVDLKNEFLAVPLLIKDEETVYLGGWMESNNGAYQLFEFKNCALSSGNEFPNSSRELVSHAIIKTKEGNTLVAAIEIGSEELSIYSFNPQGQTRFKERHLIPNLKACNAILEVGDKGFTFFNLLQNDNGSFSYNLLKTDGEGKTRIQ